MISRIKKVFDNGQKNLSKEEMIIQNDSNSLLILTKVANVFLPHLSLKHGGIAAFGYQKANPAKLAHNIEISSKN